MSRFIYLSIYLFILMNIFYHVFFSLFEMLHPTFILFKMNFKWLRFFLYCIAVFLWQFICKFLYSFVHRSSGSGAYGDGGGGDGGSSITKQRNKFNPKLQTKESCSCKICQLQAELFSIFFSCENTIFQNTRIHFLSLPFLPSGMQPLLEPILAVL